MPIPDPYLGLHLGAEYNRTHGDAGDPMNELVRRYFEGALRDPNYFPLLVEQVACFGDPRRFYYDDVSRVRAGGRHSEDDLYRENVRQSVGGVSTLVKELDPRIIIVAGGLAFTEFVRQVLPAAPLWRGDLVKARNPSSRGHYGTQEAWQLCYRRFRSALSSEPRPQEVRKWHLHATDAAGPLRLTRL
jgi:hypothetical protein